MTVTAVEALRLTDKARAELRRDRPAIPDWCSSLWNDTGPVRHQCVRGRLHDGRCQCACGAER